jgi:hypothetical protein
LRWGRSAWRGYTVLAVQTCSVLLILLLVNVAACRVLSITDAGQRHRLPATLTALQSRFGPEWVSILYPGWGESNLLRLYDEWLDVSFDYEPFTQFKVHSMQGA